MANEEHLKILKQGVDVWNEWRKHHVETSPDLRAANLQETDLSEASLGKADLHGAYLLGANLHGTDLTGAKLSTAYLLGANLSNADLSEAVLMFANLNRTDLSSANLSEANLDGTDLSKANLSESDFSRAKLVGTCFGDVDLSAAKGLHDVYHIGPSIIGIDTIYKSGGQIPEEFLRGAGVPDTFIEYMRSLVVKPIEFYSCFISYSNKDEDFAQRLYADLQSNGVRCWFAPEDMKIGDRIRDRIDQTIRVYDKLLLILSEHSIHSQWVEQEVEAALEKERKTKTTILFPVRLDEAVMTVESGWARLVRNTRHIGDFINWKDHDAYQKAFDRLLRDLKAEDTEK